MAELTKLKLGCLPRQRRDVKPQMSPVVIVIVVVVLSRVVVVVVWEVTFPLGYMQQTYQNYGTLCLAAATKILKHRAQQHLGVLGSSPFAANHSAHTLMGRDAAILEASGAVWGRLGDVRLGLSWGRLVGPSGD